MKATLFSLIVKEVVGCVLLANKVFGVKSMMKAFEIQLSRSAFCEFASQG